MAEWDLTQQITQRLDKHMVLHVLNFVKEKKIYKTEDVSQEYLRVLSETKMIEVAIDEYKLLNGGKESTELNNMKDEVYAEIDKLRAQTQPLLDLFDELRGPAVVGEAENKLTDELFTKYRNSDIQDETVNALYAYAKLEYDIGQYEEAAQHLKYFRILSQDPDKKFMALWGQLAANILNVQWDAAKADLTLLCKEIETSSGDHLLKLEQRSWLIHWALFIYFNLPDADIFEFLRELVLLNTIETSCPHILRYLVASVVVRNADQQRKHIKDIVRILVAERDAYSDPITEFLIQLFDEYDFEAAHTCLKQCRVVIANDFFLGCLLDDFLQNARILMFDQYCRLHKNIDITVLGDRLDFKDGSDPESQIVDLIKDARLHNVSSKDFTAKIDSHNNQLVIPREHPSVYKQLLDRAKYNKFKAKSLELVNSAFNVGRGHGGGQRSNNQRFSRGTR